MSTVLARPDTAVRAASVAFHGVGKSFPSRHGNAQQILADVTFTAEPGEIVAILGASGCGKSTLLRTVGGLATPTAGRVCIDGTDVRGIDPRCAVGFQEPRLLPWRTVARNVALGLPRGTSAARSRTRVAELLELVGLSQHAEHRPGEISGGMAQRASLARALARNPQVLLLDEPFGALDALTRLKMQDLVLRIHRADPATVLLVTHDVEEALVLADRVVVLGKPAPNAPNTQKAPNNAPATVVESLTVDLPRPRDRQDPTLVALRTRLLSLLGVEH